MTLSVIARRLCLSLLLVSSLTAQPASRSTAIRSAYTSGYLRIQNGKLDCGGTKFAPFTLLDYTRQGLILNGDTVAVQAPGLGYLAVDKSGKVTLRPTVCKLKIILAEGNPKESVELLTRFYLRLPDGRFLTAEGHALSWQPRDLGESCKFVLDS